jgi:hypothetical protein
LFLISLAKVFLAAADKIHKSKEQCPALTRTKESHMKVSIYIDGEFHSTVSASHVDSALDAIDLEFDIEDTTFVGDDTVELTSAEG